MSMQVNYQYPLNDVREFSDLRQMLAQSVERFADNAAFKIKDARISGREIKFDRRGLPKRSSHYISVSYRRFQEDINSLGNAILKRWGQEHRIAIIGPNRYEWYVSYLTAVNGLGVAVPLDNELPAAELLNLLRRSRADIIIYAGNKAEWISEMRMNLPHLRHFIAMDRAKSAPEDEYFWDLISTEAVDEATVQRRKIKEMALAAGLVVHDPFEEEEPQKRYEELPIDNQVLAVLIFTSGTTSQAKAVMLSHANLCANIRATLQMISADDHNTFLSLLPLHHTYECTCGFLAPMCLGAAVAVCDGLRYIVSNMAEAEVSIVLVVPLILQSFHKKIWQKATSSLTKKYTFNSALRMSEILRKIGVDKRKRIFSQVHKSFGGSLRMIICGGAAIEPQIIHDFEALGFACFQGYGLTECSPILALNRDGYSRHYAAGLPMPGCEVRLINCDENNVGEVIGRGPNVMLGYYEDEEKTREVFDDEGFFHTGDYGYFDEEGFLVLTGRKANIIVTANGKNIFPEEIESLLAEYDLVSEVIVTGRVRPNGETELFAYIFPNMEFAAMVPELAKAAIDSPEIRDALQEIVRSVNKQLSNYKHVKDFAVRTREFEKTTTKKIKRRNIFETEDGR